MANALSLSPGPYLGNDGAWTSYGFSVGTPSKNVYLLPSTVLSDTYTMNPNVCTSSEYTNCETIRGGTFDQRQSSTFKQFGSQGFGLGIAQGFGFNQREGGPFGTENLILNTARGPAPVSGSVVASVTTSSTFTGLFGLHSKQVELTGASTTYKNNSTLQIMKDSGLIPSLSYSYSAGAIYNETQGFLILGGYDTASSVPNNIVEFPFAVDVNNYLRATIQSITTTTNGRTTTLSNGAIDTLIDSTIPQLWLPQDVCDAFQDAFGLQYWDITQLYTINSTARAANIRRNAQVSFQLATSPTSPQSVTITFPYNAFDGNYTGVNSASYNTSYFPIRVGSGNGQFSLGRAFLQEAVLTVDHERKNFSLSQVVNLKNSQPNIQNILSTTATNGNGTNTPTLVPSPGGGGGGISGGAIGGIVVAVVAIIAGIIGFFFWRRRRNHKKYGSPETTTPETPGPLPTTYNEKSPPAHELHTPRPESSTDYFGAYASQQRQHHKAALSNTSSELEGFSGARGRARSPAPAYVPTISENPAGGQTSQSLPVELPAGMTASELQSRHVSSTSVPNFGLISAASSPPINSPISELAPTPGEDGVSGISPSDMGWGNSPVEEHPPVDGETAATRSAERVALSPVRGAHIRDVRGTERPRAAESPGIGSSRGSTGETMQATSGPMPSGPMGLGLAMPSDREPSESLRRNDSTRSRTSRTSDSTLVSAITGGGTLPPVPGAPSALQSPVQSAAIPRKPIRDP